MKAFRMVGYMFLFVLSFVFFLYQLFPYETLKERIVFEIERQMGGDVEVSLSSLKPYYLSGVRLKKLEIKYHDGEEIHPFLNVDEARGRLSILSSLFGNPQVTFMMKTGKGEIEGRCRQAGGLLNVDFDLSDLDLSSFGILQSRFGMKMMSRIDGNVRLNIDQQNAMRSNGEVNLIFRALALDESQVAVGEEGLPIPAVVIARGNDARLQAKLARGVLTIDEFKLTGGDLGLDLSGKVFLSNEVENYRLNLSGSFSDTPKLGEAFPFLFIIEKQKRADGSYPLTMTGRLSQPSIKVGTFTLPL